MLLAQIIVYTFLAYLAIGIVFALYFVIFAADKLDPSARGAGFFFRLVIFPAAAALWPCLAFRLLKYNAATGEGKIGV